jgi:hypothetical protein
MGITRILKPGLLVYEFVRVFLTVYVIASLLPGMSTIPFLMLAAPFTLFPLMALFIWLDTEKYKAFIPLYLAGKCINVFILLGWLIIYRWSTIPGVETVVFRVLRSFQTILLSGDFFTIAAIIFIMKKVQTKSIETPKLEEK